MTALRQTKYLRPEFVEANDASELTKDQAATLGGMIVALEQGDDVAQTIARYAKNPDRRIVGIAVYLADHARFYRTTEVVLDEAVLLLEGLSPDEG